VCIRSSAMNEIIGSTCPSFRRFPAFGLWSQSNFMPLALAGAAIGMYFGSHSGIDP